MKFKHFLIGVIFLNLLVIVGCNSQTTEHQSNVKTGEEVFKESCISCHSTDHLEGGSYKLRTENLKRFFNDEEHLLKFVSRNMPENAPNSLTDEEYEAVVDYLWLEID